MKTSKSHWHRLRTNLFALTAVAGLLIWAKLRLVTNFPRTVLADPEPVQVDADAPEVSAEAPVAPPEKE